MHIPRDARPASGRSGAGHGDAPGQQASQRRGPLWRTAAIVLALVALAGGSWALFRSLSQGSDQQHKHGHVTLFPFGQDVEIGGLAAGPDGNIWFTKPRQSRIGRITPAGRITEFALPQNTAPYAITAGPEGSLWFMDANGPRLGRITTQGVVSEYQLPEDRQSGIGGLAAGPDGNLWYTDGQHVGRVTPNGATTTFTFPPNLGPNAGAIVSGPDGNLWTLDLTFGNLWRITPHGSFMLFGGAVPGFPSICCFAVGPDHNFWLVNQREVVVKSASGESLHEFPLPSASFPISIAPGPDRALWFSEAVRVGEGPEEVRIARLSLDGTLAEFPVPTYSSLDPYSPLGATAESGATSIVAGADGAIWFIDHNALGRLTW